MKRKLVDSKVIIKAPGWSFTKELYMEGHDPHIREAYTLNLPDLVNAVAITPENELLLVQQYRHPVGQPIIELPGGKMEAKDISPAAAIHRELLEETGYDFSTIRPLGSLLPFPIFSNTKLHMFLATDGKPAIPGSSDEEENIEKVLHLPLEQAAKAIIAGQLLQNLHVVTFFYSLPLLNLPVAIQP